MRPLLIGLPLLIATSGCPDFPAHLLVPGDEAGVLQDGAVPDAPTIDGSRLDAVADGLTADSPAVDAPLVDTVSDGPPADTGHDATLDGSVDAAPDLPPPDLPPPDLPPDSGCLASHDPAWWNGAYSYRVPLTVTESVSGAVAAGYSVSATIDTQSLVAAGKLLATAHDLRVVYHGGATPQQLDRHVVGLGSSTTRVWFKTPSAIDGSHAGYFLYYGNPAAGAPPAHWADSMGAAGTPSAVYLAADDFEEHAAGAAPDGWQGSVNYLVELDGSNKVLGVSGADGPADYLFAGDLGWTDVAVSARLRIIDTSGNHYGLWVRADGTSSFRTVFWGLSDNSTLQVWSCRIASPTATALSASSLLRSWSLGSAAGTSWHKLQVQALGQSLGFAFDGQQRGSVSLLANQMKQGRIGLCAGYPTTRALWDDIVVRRFVDPEPAVASGAETALCP